MSAEIKQRMNIALVGVRPADQVMLKGYFRILLRLDVELNWVSASEKAVDLFIINGEFANAASVIKLLAAHKSTPVLYVERDSAGIGGIDNNTLTIPLRQLNLLNDWLLAHLPALGENPAPSQKTEDRSTTKPKPESLKTVVEMIKTLQARPKSNYELMDGDKVIAIIDAHRQLIWQQGSVSKITPSFYLRSYTGQLPDEATARDSAHYLWFLAWHNPDAIVPLVNNNTKYRLRFWAKPPVSFRKDLLQVMTALEKDALTVNEITARARVSGLTAKKALAALLASGHLGEETYRTLTYLVETPETESKAAEIPERIPAPPPISEEAQDEKASFLSRLRRKLGI